MYMCKQETERHVTLAQNSFKYNDYLANSVEQIQRRRMFLKAIAIFLYLARNDKQINMTGKVHRQQQRDETLDYRNAFLARDDQL